MLAAHKLHFHWLLLFLCKSFSQVFTSRAASVFKILETRSLSSVAIAGRTLIFELLHLVKVEV